MRIRGKTSAEIYDCVRALTQSRQLLPGDALPPVRELAAELGIGRNTVAAAYRRLTTTGITASQGRLGTVIRDQYASREQEGARADTPLVDLASGNPNADWLPDVAAALRLRPYVPRLYGAPTVNAGLRAYLHRWMAPDCPADGRIDLTHGAIDAIERLLGAYLVAGDKVAVENPCFLSSINTLRTLGLQAAGVSVDAQGMRPEELDEALRKGARAVILTPRAHNPTGCSLSEARALVLARVMARYPEALVIADDHFALLSRVAYHSPIPPNAVRWALVRSFSKALGPDIRVAAVASDASTANQLGLRLASGTSWVSHLLQDIVEAGVTRPENRRLMADAAEDYVRRRRMLETALSGQGVGFVAQGDGLNFWIPLRVDDQAVALALAQRGWLVRHGGSLSVREAVRGLRITLSTLDPAQCDRLARDIGDTLG